MKKTILLLLLMMCHSITSYTSSFWDEFKRGYNIGRDVSQRNPELGFWDGLQVVSQEIQKDDKRRAVQMQLDYHDSDDEIQKSNKRVTIVGIEEIEDSSDEDCKNETTATTNSNGNTIYRENRNRRVKNSRTNHNTNYQHVRASTNGALLMSGVMIVCIGSYIFYQWWSKRQNDHHAYHRA